MSSETVLSIGFIADECKMRRSNNFLNYYVKAGWYYWFVQIRE